MLVCLDPRLPEPNGLGEFSIGLIAGNGIEGAGDADLLIDGDEPNDDLRLWDTAGGFIGSAKDVGVPGMDGAGEPGASEDASVGIYGRKPGSGGAGLLEEILRQGKSIFVTLLYWLSVNCPSLVLRV